jgi:hypothetical protein
MKEDTEQLESIKSLAEKLRAMADPARGATAAEIKIATDKLHALLERHKLKEEDLFSDAVCKLPYLVHSKHEEKLFFNCAAYILDQSSIKHQIYKRKGWGMSKGKMVTEINLDATLVQHADIRACFHFYREKLNLRLDELKREKAKVTRAINQSAVALISRYNLYPKSAGTSSSTLTRAQMEAIMHAMRGMDNEKWVKPEANLEASSLRLTA